MFTAERPRTARRAADPGAVHQHPRDTVGSLGLGDRRLDLLLVGDVGVKRYALYFRRNLFRVFLALVEQADLATLGGHAARGGSAETRAPAGDENGNVFQLHCNNLSLGVSSRL